MMESTQQSSNERSASQSMRSESVHTIINRIAEGETLPTQTVMKYELLRFQTFRSFPRENKPFITRLAQAGFCYTKNGDEVVCYCCTKKRCNWQESDNPMDVHRELDPNCSFLINNAEVNVPITYREQDEDDSSSSTEANSRSQVGEHCECSEENSSRENLGSARNHTSNASDINSSDSERNKQNVNVQNRQTVDTVREDQLLQNRRSTLTDFSGTERRYQPFTLREADCPVSLRELQSSNSTTAAAGPVTPPKHPKYASLTVRLSSFSDCREIVVRPEHLAEAGFFYAGFGDCVRCFQCGLGLRHWSEEDDPWIEHARWSKECSFVRQNRGIEFVNLVQMAVRYSQQENASRQSFTGENQGAANADENDQLMHTNAAQSVLEMGYDPGIIRRAIQQVIASSGRKSLNAANLMEKIFEIEESAVVVQQSSVNNDTQRNQNELPERNNAVKQSKDVPLTSSENGCCIDTEEKSSQSQKNGSAPALVTRSTTSPPAVKGATGEDSSAARKAYLLEKKRLKQENERLKQESICAKCKKNLVTIVFLPCGHLVTCEDCAPAVKHCLVETCGKYIKGTVRAYMP